MQLNVDEMRQAWRDGKNPSLERRRKIALLSVVGMVDFGIISLYQLGVIRRLPELPGRIFDSNQVNASHKAFALGLPDGSLGAVLYAMNLVLLSFGGTKETGRPPAFSFLLGGAVLAGVGGALHYLYDMALRQQKACPYCIVGALTHFCMVPFVIPEIHESQRFVNVRSPP